MADSFSNQIKSRISHFDPDAAFLIDEEEVPSEEVQGNPECYWRKA